MESPGISNSMGEQGASVKVAAHGDRDYSAGFSSKE
jgi:hypothetical protein